MRTQKRLTMKKFFTLLLLLFALRAGAQQFNNEWINYNQTYYKFKVSATGLYRIPQATLNAAGIGSIDVQNFELWRNGKQVPFYPSVPSGPLPANGYLEFWGKQNDGEPDKPLYRDPAYQHTEMNSLINDTAAYFLSVNTNQSGLVVIDMPNDVAGNSLPVLPYFMHKTGTYFRNRLNPGFAAVVGEYVFSSSYDKGEYWSSATINPASPLTTTLINLQVYAGGPASTLSFGASGNALNPRNVRVNLNGTDVKDTIMDYFNDVNTTLNISTSAISSNTATIKFTNTSGIGSDRMVISYAELNYPRLFNFDNKKSFEFSLPATASGYYLEITNFNAGSAVPALYDLSSGRRYLADNLTAGVLKFALPPTGNTINYVLVNEDASNTISVNEVIPRNFINYTNTANQGDYTIITDMRLNTGTNGRHPLTEYQTYRSSVAGGGYKAIVVDINELVDQFAFGIGHHPLSVRNFIRFARAQFNQGIKYVFLVGRGMTYSEYRLNQNAQGVNELNLVPTFGNPASDNMLSAADVSVPVPATPIGRLSVVRGSEIEDYLEKLIEYESAQLNAPNTLAGRMWMKNVIHVTGASDPYLGVVLCNYMGTYKQIIEDTLFGGNVYTFCKTSASSVETLNSEKIAGLFSEGVSFLTYFGHSSATTLEFNLDNPAAYEYNGRYPIFFVNGCNAGNFFTYYPQRLLVNETLSEKFVLAKQSGSVAFMASTHFGIVNYLNIYLNNLYATIGKKDFGHSLGEINTVALKGLVDATGPYDFYSRMHAEEITLHGDPALRISAQEKPDYVIEESLIKIEPTFISVAADKFRLKVGVANLGKAIGDSVRLEVTRQYPDGTTDTLYAQKIRGVRNMDSVVLEVPVVASRDKGSNRITATIDGADLIDEIAETNNSATKEFFIYEDEARPIYPYNYGIVTTPTVKLSASTADPFSQPKDYVMEMDTTQNFNSTLKVTKTVNTSGGVIEFDPGITLVDSTVYYWRVALKPDQGSEYRWNNSSFAYFNGTAEGFNQSHLYQHQNSEVERLSLYNDLQWRFGENLNSLFLRNAVYPIGSNLQADFEISVNGGAGFGAGCSYNELIFTVLDPKTFKPWKNVYSASSGLYKSFKATCGSGREYNFEYLISDSASRNNAVRFLKDIVPDGAYVVVRTNSHPDAASSFFVDKWKDDTLRYGTNQSLYHALVEFGFGDLDNYSKPRAFNFVFRKGHPEYPAQSQFTDSIFDRISLTLNCPTPDTLGYIKSPLFGPAKTWGEVQWYGKSVESPSNDVVTVEVLGVDTSNNETLLYSLDASTHNFDVSSVDPSVFPYMRLRMINQDSVTLSPYQLKNWRVIYAPAPEGALAPNLFLSIKDTLEVGETLQFKVAFKNVSKIPFDSIFSKISIFDKNNIEHRLDLPKSKPLISGDTIMLVYSLDTREYAGINLLFVEVNPNFHQPEQYHFNNILYYNFYVRPDLTNPLLDVTFDGVHILNRDIVSAKPHISIKLKDDAKYLLLNDTTLASVQVRYPDGTLRRFHFDNDTLRFVPATNGNDNAASIEFYPQFLEATGSNGDEYELIVMARDRSGNKTGQIDYHITFKVISKPMISNLLNYPNPFSTSTAFVFTLTGSELPQNMKIQILTVTGKIVREITMSELGPLHIGRNITEYKWDGTDQYGQKLGNGVYLYRVVTTLNGKSMEKYKADGDNTDKFFNNGYGKMYLMR